MARTRELDVHEIRVLGALMEKELQTPDHYPMTISAIITACNQKTSRHPVTALSETEVVEALDRMRRDVITWREEGPRAERWKQSVDRRWELDRPRKAIMTVLLLRGPQTPGDLKTRCERSYRFESKGAIQEVLEEMSEGVDALVENIGRLPGHREERWRHLVGRAEDRDHLTEAPPSAASRSSRSAGRLNEIAATIETLEERVALLERELLALRVRLGDEDADRKAVGSPQPTAEATVSDRAPAESKASITSTAE